jgi:hypothetical protein
MFFQKSYLGIYMTVRKISRSEVLKDIRSGMDENALGLKYKLSVVGLRSLYKKLIEAGVLQPDLSPVRRRLNLKEILADISKGMSKANLMDKYELSSDMLRKVSQKLLAARGVRSVADGPDTIIEESPDYIATRELVRHEVDFDLPVYEAARPEIHGMVKDVSEEGLGVGGIQANVGDVKTLVVMGDEFGEFSSFEFEGYCRWGFTDAEDGISLTGFAISKISDKDMEELRKLVRLVTLGG